MLIIFLSFLRPLDPIEYVAAFLMKNKEKYTPKYKPESLP